MSLVQSARKINEEESSKIAHRIKDYALSINAKTILLLGLSYKENTPDCRNTKVADVYNKLKTDFSVVDCLDPIVNKEEILRKYKISIFPSVEDLTKKYDLVIKMVNHNVFEKIKFGGSKIKDLNDFL